MKKTTEFKALQKLRSKLKWRTAFGDHIALKDMEKSHIQNTIVYLSKKQEEFDTYGVGSLEIDDMSASEWIEIFMEELKFRNKN